jgi:hypothetical protein
MAMYAGITGSDETVKVEIALEIMADSQAEAMRKASQI